MFESTPQYPLKHPHHRKHLAILVLAIVVFIVVMIAYIYRAPSGGSLDTPQPVDVMTVMRQQMVRQLQASSYTVPDASAKAAIVKRLQTPPGISTEQKSEIIEQLRAR